MTLHPRTARLLLLACLLALSTAANAREVRLQGPNGDGGNCPGQAEVDNDAPAPASQKRNAGATPDKLRATTPATRGSGGGGGETSARPRWHSFLPGMFR